MQKTFASAKLLTGFTDETHRMAVTGEYIRELDPLAQQQQLDAAAVSRAFVATLPPFQLSELVIRPTQGLHIERIQNDPVFRQTLGQRPHQFAYINISQLVALQAWIEPRGDRIPTLESELLSYALPPSWDVPAEVTFVQPAGPIQIMTSSPAMQGVQMEFDEKTGTVRIGAPKHINLIQVIRVAGRGYLTNGYHRVSDAIAAGVTELPALVIEGIMGPGEIPNLGHGGFNPLFLVGMPRPPLVQDFYSAAAISTKVRERRYGVLVEVIPKPIVIGI